MRLQNSVLAYIALERMPGRRNQKIPNTSFDRFMIVSPVVDDVRVFRRKRLMMQESSPYSYGLQQVSVK